MHGRTKNNRLNNVLPVYFLPVWGNLASFHQNKSGLPRSRKRRSQRLDSRSRPKINSGNWSLVVIQKFFLLKIDWSGKLLSRKVGRTLPDGSLDMRHLIIILTKIRYCKWCYCDSVICVFVRIFVNVCKILSVSCFCLYCVFQNLLCVMYKSLHNLFYCKNYVVSNVVSSQILCFFF